MTLSQTLLKAIERAGVTRYRISRDTGIEESALSRFVSGKRGLGLDSADALARYFNLELRPKVKKKAR
jgi:transcriptional regulator with XRE-family HTH domain